MDYLDNNLDWPKLGRANTGRAPYGQHGPKKAAEDAAAEHPLRGRCNSVPCRRRRRTNTEPNAAEALNGGVLVPGRQRGRGAPRASNGALRGPHGLADAPSLNLFNVVLGGISAFGKGATDLLQRLDQDIENIFIEANEHSIQHANQRAHLLANQRAHQRANPQANQHANQQANQHANQQANRHANQQANQHANQHANQQANQHADQQANQQASVTRRTVSEAELASGTSVPGRAGAAWRQSSDGLLLREGNAAASDTQGGSSHARVLVAAHPSGHQLEQRRPSRKAAEDWGWGVDAAAAPQHAEASNHAGPGAPGGGPSAAVPAAHAQLAQKPRLQCTRVPSQQQGLAGGLGERSCSASSISSGGSATPHAGQQGHGQPRRKIPIMPPVGASPAASPARALALAPASAAIRAAAAAAAASTSAAAAAQKQSNDNPTRLGPAHVPTPAATEAHVPKRSTAVPKATAASAVTTPAATEARVPSSSTAVALAAAATPAASTPTVTENCAGTAAVLTPAGTEARTPSSSTALPPAGVASSVLTPAVSEVHASVPASATAGVSNDNTALLAHDAGRQPRAPAEAIAHGLAAAAHVTPFAAAADDRQVDSGSSHSFSLEQQQGAPEPCNVEEANDHEPNKADHALPGGKRAQLAAGPAALLDMGRELRQDGAARQTCNDPAGGATCSQEQRQQQNHFPAASPWDVLPPADIPQWSFHIDPGDLALKEKLGSGAFGEVYRALWRDTPVAVKLVALDSMSPNEKKACMSELWNMFRLRHPNIVQLFGASVMPSGTLAIVLELVPRGSLYSLLHLGMVPFDTRRRLRMALDVAKGLQYLHGLSPPLVHRDIKSMNLLVAADWSVKVCDFGLSRPKYTSHISTMTSGIGTPAWMAPEVWLGAKCNEKSDVYSYGMVMYELFTGQLPWADVQHTFQLLHLVGNEGLRPDLPEDLDKGVARLIKACWAQDPRERPSFNEVLAELRTMVS